MTSAQWVSKLWRKIPTGEIEILITWELESCIFILRATVKQKISIQNGPIQSFWKVSKTEQSATQSSKSLNGKSIAHISAVYRNSKFEQNCQKLDTNLLERVLMMTLYDLWYSEVVIGTIWGWCLVIVGMKLNRFSDLKTCWDIKSDKTHPCCSSSRPALKNQNTLTQLSSLEPGPFFPIFRSLNHMVLLDKTLNPPRGNK